MALTLPTSRMRSGLSASTTSRLAVLPRPVMRPTSGRLPMSGSRNSRSSGRLARGQPISSVGRQRVEHDRGRRPGRKHALDLARDRHDAPGAVGHRRGARRVRGRACGREAPCRSVRRSSCIPRWRPANACRVESRPRHGGVREEQLLAADLVVGDRLLPLRRHEPVDERLRRAPSSRADAWPDSPAMTPYWLNRRLSPSTTMARSPRFLNDSQVPRSVEHVGVARRRGVERRAHALADLLVPAGLVVAAMSMSAAFQSASSAACVPDLSPRETNGAPWP